MSKQTIQPQIGALAKREIIDDLLNIEAVVFALVSSIEKKHYPTEKSEMERGMIKSSDLMVPHEKAVLRVLTNAFVEEISNLKTQIEDMTVIMESQ